MSATSATNPAEAPDTATELVRATADALRTFIGATAPTTLGGKFDNRPTWSNTSPAFDNRPTWDNWHKK